MKISKYLVVALTLTFMLVGLVGCGGTSVATTPKDDFLDYLNNQFVPIFGPENNDIVAIYTEAGLAKDSKILAKTLSQIPPKSNALLEKLKAFTPKTTEVQDLHNLLIKAVELRKEAYAQVLEVLTENSPEAQVNAAFAKLDESDAKFEEFLTKAESMKKDFGLVDAK